MRKSKINLMISSRCADHFPDGQDGSMPLTDIRRQIKALIETTSVFGKPIFEAWINEDAPPQPGNQDSWEFCLKQVRSADILLVLYNGNAGWKKTDGEIGICHAELMEGIRHAPGKVHLISLLQKSNNEILSNPANKRFHYYVTSLNLFRGIGPKNREDLIEQVRKTIRESLVTFVERGVREASKGRFHTGQALDWSRLNFPERIAEITKIVTDAICMRTGQNEKDGLFVEVSKSKVLTIPSAIPAALSISAAREMVGQPFLQDHLHVKKLRRGVFGPMHIIGCHKGVTENQAATFLGYPDATLVAAPFGIYVADEVQNIQLVLLSNCRDETTNRHGIQRFFEWIEQTGEDQFLLRGAESRKRIVKAIAKELQRTGT